MSADGPKSTGKKTHSSNRKDDILHVAEQLAVNSGYHGFSFRDIAAHLNVTSPSVHYYFKTKEHLALTLVERVRDRFFLKLGPADSCDALTRFASCYRAECLGNKFFGPGNLFAGEHGGLPLSVRSKICDFMDEAIDWTAAAILYTYNNLYIYQTYEEHRRKIDPDYTIIASTVLSSLEGAFLIARAFRDPALLENVSRQIFENLAPLSILFERNK